MQPSANPWIAQLNGYQPGKRHSGGHARPVKLSSNENPLGGPARIARLISDAPCDIGRYPDDASDELRAALAAHTGVTADEVLVGSGSSDILSMIAKAYLAPGRTAVVSSYTFMLYALIAEGAGATVRTVSSAGFGHDPAALAAAAQDPAVSVLFIDNPCNPTGTYLNGDALAGLLAAVPPQVLVVIDEAYAEYATQDDYRSCVGLTARHPNLLVVRTFSKAYGLAGVRLGYCIGAAELIATLNRVRPPFNVSTLAGMVGLAALRDQGFVQDSRSLNLRERERVTATLDRLGLQPLDSAANFIFFYADARAQDLAAALEQHGVLVRLLAAYPGYLRVTVGLPEENQRFLDVLQACLSA